MSNQEHHGIFQNQYETTARKKITLKQLEANIVGEKFAIQPNNAD